MPELVLTGCDLTPEVLEAVARQRQPIGLADGARAAVELGAALIDDIVREERRTYGINTGFGALSVVTISAAALGQLQLNLLRSHAAGVGPPLADDVVRAMLLLRANTLARGHSGVRPAVIDRLLDLLNADVCPVVPSKGSVGASGDLAPLAHLALPLVGEGRVTYGDRELPAAEVHRILGWTPLVLGPKEGLALINGTQASVAIGILALLDAEALLRQADIIGALTLEAMGGRPSAFDPRIHALRPIPGQVTTAANLRRLLAGSSLTTTGSDATQDPYSLRCMPQVHGASRESVGFARRILAIEANAVTDNPLVFPDTGEVISGGNFHGEPVAQALDAAAIGLASLSAISERRLDRLVSGLGPQLPMFLSGDPGLSSGFMMVHVTAAALCSENKHLAGPASVDNIPTSAGKEDHVSFSTYAARKFATIVDNTTSLLAAELLAACQALDFRGVDAASPAARAVHAVVRAAIPTLDHDREMHLDLATAGRLLRERRVLAAAPID